MGRMRSGLIGLLTLGTALFGAYEANAQEADSTVVKKNPLEISASTSFVNAFVAPPGPVIPGGPYSLNSFSVAKGNLSASYFSAYDLGSENMDFTNIGIKYSKNLSKKVSGDIGVGYVMYPDKISDRTLTAGLEYKGNVFTTSAGLTSFFARDDISHGNVFVVKFKKRLYVYGEHWEANANVSFAYLDNFYKNSGLSRITPGVDVHRSFGANNKWKGSASFNWQLGFKEDAEIVPAMGNQFYYEIKLARKF